MKILKEIRYLTFRCIRAVLRNPVFLFMGVITPLLYLALFAPLLKTAISQSAGPAQNVLDLFVPGMLPIIAFSTGIFTGFGIIDDLKSGVIERFRVTTTSRFAILMGPVCLDGIATLIQSLFFILIAIPFGFRASIGGLAILFVLLILLSSITSSFGNALGVILKSEDRYAPIVQGINLPILLLSGTLLPMSLAPTWLKVLAHCNPVYYVVEASRALAIGNYSSPNVLYAFLILIPSTLLTLYFATSVYRKAVT